MHHPRPLLALLALALLPATIGTAHAAAEPMVAAPRSVPAASALAGAHLLGRQALDTPVSAALTLPLRNQAALDTLLHRLYTPGDPLRGHYLTPAQFDAQFGPTQADYDAVTTYLRAQGLTVHPYASRTLVGVSSTSGGVESAFHVHLNRYLTASGRVAYANDAAPLLPASIVARIGGVVGLDNLVVPHPHLVARRPTSILSTPIGNGPGGGLSPTDITSVYNLNARSGVQLAGEGQSLGLLELDGYDTGDIRQYITQFGLPIDPNDTDTLVNLPTSDFSGPSGTSNEAEVVLDIDMMLAVAPRVNHIYVYETDDSKTIGILQLLTNMASDDFAQSISCSWGLAEDIIALQESNSQYTTLLNAENVQLQKMSAQGQSFFDAAGDAGAYADEPDLGAAATISVQDPACQPYATTVGGTTLNAVDPNTTNIAYGSESTWNDGVGDAGGGGFSSFFLKPFYQYSSGSTEDPTDPVGATGGTYGLVPGITPVFPSTPRRDLPDVSLNADPQTGYTIFVGLSGDSYDVFGGTSAAAPLWAAFTALANEARAADALGVTPGVSPGLPITPVGFINPLIYQIGYGQYGSYANDFHDIDDGSDNLVYRAGIGFDDATGWGSFNGANLLRDLAAKAPNSGSGTTSGTQTTVTNGTFPPGFQMISAPEQFPTGDTFAQLFGLNTQPSNGPMLFQWQPSTQTYANSNTAGSAADTLVPGEGYWLYVPTYLSPGLSLAVTGTTPTAPVSITLQAGWNQIGDPFPTTELLSNIAIAAASSGTGAPPPPPAPGTPGAPTLANTPSLVYGTLYSYPAGAHQYTTTIALQGGAALQPYAGYWVYAFQPVTLTFQ